MSHPTIPHKTTIFIWPTGLFPRRIIYLLRARSLTLSSLHAQNIHLVPIQLTPARTALVSHPDYESRPEGTSLPIMKLEFGPSDDTAEEVVWIRESAAIMAYLEELFPSASSSRLQRARAADVLSVLSDAVVWSVVSLAHSNPSTSAWSGLAESDMAPAAAAHAERKMKALLEKLDGWVGENMAGGKSKNKSLAGGGSEVTVADVALMAQVEYMREVYGVEWIAGHEALGAWWEGMRGEKWVVGRGQLEECERTGRWEGVLGG